MSNGYGAKASQYRQTSILTATRGQLLILLYEGCIQNVKKATVCIEKGDLAAKGIAIVKAHDILNELLNTLDFEVGGVIARDLERLYNFMIGELVKANMSNTKEPLIGIQKLLESLLDGWKQAIAQVQKESAQKGGK